MISDDNFFARWSRLKRSAAQGKKARADVRPQDARQGDDAEARQARSALPDEHPRTDAPPFDPATLPPIESIVADSDIRAFLRSQVPAHLARAALRRAWVADPAIRDFIGIAENQWDFTDPASIPGFGSLEATDNLRQLVTQAMGELPQTAEAVTPLRDVDALLDDQGIAPTAMTSEAPAMNLRPDPDGGSGDDQVAGHAAAQHPAIDNDGLVTPGRRGHGGALPT